MTAKSFNRAKSRPGRLSHRYAFKKGTLRTGLREAEIRPLGVVERAAHRPERRRTPDQRQPEEDQAVGEHGGHGGLGGSSLDDQRADEAEVDPAHAAGDRKSASELPDEVAHQD